MRELDRKGLLDLNCATPGCDGAVRTIYAGYALCNTCLEMVFECPDRLRAECEDIVFEIEMQTQKCFLRDEAVPPGFNRLITRSVVAVYQWPRWLRPLAKRIHWHWMEPLWQDREIRRSLKYGPGDGKP